jgi:HSP20 family protein
MANDTAIERTQGQAIETKPAGERERTLTYRPNVDIVENNEEFQIVADLPGADREKIDVAFQEDVLTIDAPVEPRYSESSEFHRQEYGVAGFHRRFVVEGAVEPDRMTADYDNGILRVRLPKSEKARGRKIPVTSA